MLRITVLVSLLALLCVAVQADPGRMIEVNGRAMISLHAFCHRFDAVVGYDLSRGAITVMRGARAVYLIPYSNTAWVDNVQVPLRNPVIIVDDITYVPLHFMCHAFELDCTWNPDRSQAFVIVNMPDGNAERVEFDRNDAWAQQQHVWKYNIDAQSYQHFQERPPRPVTNYPVAVKWQTQHVITTGRPVQPSHPVVLHQPVVNVGPNYQRPNDHPVRPPQPYTHTAFPAGGGAGPNYQRPTGNPGQPSYPNTHTQPQTGGVSQNNHATTGNSGQPSHPPAQTPPQTGGGSNYQRPNAGQPNHTQPNGNNGNTGDQHQATTGRHGYAKPADDQKNDRKDK